MKKNLIILALTSCLLTACATPNPHPETTAAATVPILELPSVTEEIVLSTEPAVSTAAETVPEETIQEAAFPEETEVAVPVEPATTVPEETEEEAVPAPTKPKEANAANVTSVSTQPSETTPRETIPPETAPLEANPQETEPAITVPSETVPVEAEPVITEPVKTAPPETQAPTESTERATTEFSRSDVEAALLKYINQYRGTPLTRLSGMSKVARERSKQITSRFDHITKDIRTAHAKYEYGELVDLTIHGLPESENYYSSHTGEAIAYCGQSLDVDSADEMGQTLAQQLKESSGHWSYVGSSSNVYCGIGCTKVNTDWGTVWYVCVMVGSTNFG